MLELFLRAVAGRILYLALHLESSSFPRPLSPAEEREVLAAMAAGDDSARDTIIRHNLRLVAHIAKKYYSGGADPDDLISIGTIGLMKAAASFDATRSARFSTYASRCIENAILSQMRFQVCKRTPLAKNTLAGVYSHSFQRTIILCVGLKIAWFGMHRSAYTHLG